MNDQAKQLRELVIKDALERGERDPASATCVHFCSGRPGVGTTTVALNAAIAMARGGARVVLVCIADHVDAIPPGLFEPTEACTRLLQGTLSVGPFGLHLLQHEGGDLPLDQLSQIADFVLLDVGQQSPDSYGSPDDLVVYITTLENASILDTYALMKSQANTATGFVVANRVRSETEAWAALRRFCETSEGYSGRQLVPAAVIPMDESGQVNRATFPLVLQSPNSEFAKRFEIVAESLQRTAKNESDG